MATAKFLRSFLSLVALCSPIVAVACGEPDEEPTSNTEQDWSTCDFNGLSSCLRNNGGNACYARYACANPGRNDTCVPRDQYEIRTVSESGSCYCFIPYGGTRDSATVCAQANVLCHYDCNGRKSCSFVSCRAGTTCGDAYCF